MASSPYYTLGSNPVPDEMVRLDNQHVFLRQMTHGLLPKDISNTLSTLPSPRIADVATGTAIWLLDIGSQLPPTSELHGFDIDTAKFPPAEKLPANITLHQVDARNPFPREHLGSYDLVHVSLLMYALKKDEWEAMARNLGTLLKPGGWLLWLETGYPGWVSLPPSPAVNAIMDYDIRFAQKAGRDITHPARLLAHVQNSGLVDCDERDHTDFDITDTEAGHLVFVRVLTAALRGIVDRGGAPGLKTEEDIEKLTKAVADDLSSGRSIFMAQIKWVWGRKAE